MAQFCLAKAESCSVRFSTATARQRTERLRGDQQRKSEETTGDERQRLRVDWLRVAKEQLSSDMRCEGIDLPRSAKSGKGEEQLSSGKARSALH